MPETERSYRRVISARDLDAPLPDWAERMAYMVGNCVFEVLNHPRARVKDLRVEIEQDEDMPSLIAIHVSTTLEP